MLNEKFDLALKILKEELPDGNLQYLADIAVVMIGDYLSSIWIFEIDELTAWEGAKGMGLIIAKKICSEHIEDEATRAYEYILSWYSSNYEHFNYDANPYYGCLRKEEDNDYICIYPQEFEKAMHDGGFNSRRIKQDWAERGLMLFEEGTEKTKRRLCRRLKDTYTGQMIGFICVKIEKSVPITVNVAEILEEGGSVESLDLACFF